MSVDLPGSTLRRRPSTGDRSDGGDFRIGSALSSHCAGTGRPTAGPGERGDPAPAHGLRQAVGQRVFASSPTPNGPTSPRSPATATEAEQAMAEADRHGRPEHGVLYPWLEHARCWVRASTGDLDAAVRIALDLAARLPRTASTRTLVIALHDVVRFGRPEEVGRPAQPPGRSGRGTAGPRDGRPRPRRGRRVTVPRLLAVAERFAASASTCTAPRPPRARSTGCGRPAPTQVVEATTPARPLSGTAVTTPAPRACSSTGPT